jgi:hypothetical protein
MQQIKVFVGLESDADAFERTVNHWIKTSKARVLQITGNIAPQTETGKFGGLNSGGNASDLTLFVLYEIDG